MNNDDQTAPSRKRKWATSALASAMLAAGCGKKQDAPNAAPSGDAEPNVVEVASPDAAEPPPLPPTTPKGFAMFYGDSIEARKLQDFELIVTQPHTQIVGTLPGKRTVFANITVAEIGRDQAGTGKYDDFVRWNAIIDPINSKTKEPHYKHTLIVDIRNPKVQESVMLDIDEAVKKGFKAIMLNNIDPLINLEKNLDRRLPSEKMYQGMQSELVKFIREVRKRYPDLKLMTNGAIELQPLFASDKLVDYALALNAVSRDGKLYTREADKKWAPRPLDVAMRRNPDLKVIGFDVFDHPNVDAHKDFILEVTKRHAENRWHYSGVGDPGLQDIPLSVPGMVGRGRGVQP